MAPPEPVTQQAPVTGRLVLTGAAGAIGSVLRPALAPLARELVSSDLRELTALAPTERSVVADLTDPHAVSELLRGADMVVHLGGVADEASFAELAGPNLTGSFNVLEAARRHGVRRVVYASSNRITGLYAPTDTLRGDEPVRPDGLYGATKAFGEALGRTYVDRFGLEFVAVRIGSFGERPEDARQLSTWLSPGDAVRLFVGALSAPEGLGFHVVYGVSANRRSWWAASAGDERIGFRPVDDAEAFADGLGVFESATQAGPYGAPGYGGWADAPWPG
jgi:uronate dehydrogenase